MNILTRKVAGGMLLCLATMSSIIAQDGISAVIDTNATYLLSEVFLAGDCFETSNAEIFGEYGQVGIFTNGTSSIGIESGIVLSTGNVLDIVGPNSSSTTGTGFDVDHIDPDLALVAGGQAQKDAAILEFDFTPTVEIVTFEYVFASEEYCEFAGTNWNDIFGFFVSGPGISGPYTDGGENYAKIPSTGQDVAINSVNHFINPEFYVNNIPLTQGQSCAPTEGAAVQDFEYDGYTVPLSATFEVVPCETYHIKLIVADRSDDLFDSAVFLKAGSFAAGLTATVSGEVIGQGYSPTEPFEGCGTTAFIFSRADTFITNDLVVHYSLTDASTATEGVDYSFLPDSTIIPAGVLSDTVLIDIYADNIAEGPENITLRLRNPCNCGDAEVSVTIQDPPPISTALSGDVDLCLGDSMQVAALPTGGFGDYTYQWQGGGNDSLQWITPLADGTYGLTVTDECGQEATATYEADVQAPTATIGNGGFLCDGGMELEIPIVLADGSSFSFELVNGGQSQPFNDIQQDTIWVPITEMGEYVLNAVAADGCAGQGIDTAFVGLTEILTTALVDSVSCTGADDGAASLESTGGNAPYNYDWSVGTATENSATQLPAGEITVYIADNIGCLDTIQFTVAQPAPLQAAIDTITAVADCTTPGELLGSVTGGTAPYDYSWSNNVQVAGNPDLPPGIYTLEVTDANGCTAEIAGGIDQDVDFPTASIALPDTLDCATASISLNAAASSQGPDFVYSWQDADGNALTPVDPLNWSTGDAGVYILTVTDTINGCSQVASVEVMADFSEPDALAGAAITELNCDLTELTLSAQDQNAGQVSWSWSTTDGVFSSATDSADVRITAAGWYLAQATQLSNGCVSVDSVLITIDTLSPVASLQLGEAISCSNLSSMVTATVNVGNGPFAYEWMATDGGTIQGASDGLVVEGGTAGSYTLNILDQSNQCTNSATAVIEDISTTVALDPVVDTLINCAEPGHYAEWQQLLHRSSFLYLV